MNNFKKRKKIVHLLHRIDIIEYKKKLLQTSTSIDKGNRWIPAEGICGSFFDEYHLSIVIFRLIGQNGVIGQTMLMKML